MITNFYCKHEIFSVGSISCSRLCLWMLSYYFRPFYEAVIKCAPTYLWIKGAPSELSIGNDILIKGILFGILWRICDLETSIGGTFFEKRYLYVKTGFAP